MMKKWYCVCSIFNDDGSVYANIVGTLKSYVPPENEYMRKTGCDVYTDWFDSLEEAKNFVESAENA